MNDPRQILFDRVATAPGIAGKVAQVAAGKPVRFEHVVVSAQPFLVAMLAGALRTSDRQIWVICKTERDQESFHAELTNWWPEAMIFPHAEVAVVEGALPDPETSAERLAVVERLASGRFTILVLNEHSLDEPVPTRASLKKSTLELKPGMRLDRDKLVHQLVEAGYESVPQVADRGQFSIRGGVMDLYSWQQVLPTRLEWFDDEIESVREFELDQQVSVRALEQCSVLLGTPEASKSLLRSYRNKLDFTFYVEPDQPESAVNISEGTLDTEQETEDYGTAFYGSSLAPVQRSSHSPALHDAAQHRVKGQLNSWLQDDFLLAIQCKKKSDRVESEKLLREFAGAKEPAIYLNADSVLGFVCPAAKLAVSSGAELLGYSQQPGSQGMPGSRKRRGLLTRRTQIDFTEFAEGEAVVHLEHGVARFRGLQTQAHRSGREGDRAGASEEVMVLEFADAAKLYVPLDQAYLVSRYVGLGKRNVALSHLGDGKWTSTKKTAEKSIYDYAAKLLKVQAERETHGGIVFEPDNQWQKEFENAFAYRETADQVKAIRETKEDMESGRSMDRLICGDVGFGKTEVAIRAAFKAAMNGNQVAMMVPTTVLAQQHYENFSARMANFPVTVELLSRYRTRAEQDRVAEGLLDGSVDIVIGTHRLISRDVHFKNLGLLVVDEEQRFGVRHKERIKERFPNVDVLTLSATPIPRTLYMALTGARDLSTLETAPPNRYPVETNICAYDERIIRTAIDRELDRQGQIYFLHNRVEDIQKVCARIKHLCPRAPG